MQSRLSTATGPGLGMPGAQGSHARAKLDRKLPSFFMPLFLTIVVGGLGYSLYSLISDIEQAGAPTTWLPFLLLGIALLIALGFEFVNGFHDTANAVATVIYTHALDPHVAVVWSGFWNFTGVVVSTGAVAFGIISLLPVELILQVGSSAGFAMVFALLLAAIVWNLGTWWLGLPASSSHTLIGSIIGVGIMNAVLHGRDGTSGVDWTQATKVGYSLLLSPVVGFVCAALLLLGMRALIKRRELYEEPAANEPPPFWIRCLLILTCTGVSFAHGSNDGQKGMGLIMLILIGTMPMAYALNRSMPTSEVEKFGAMATVTRDALTQPGAQRPTVESARQTLTDYIRTHEVKPQVQPAIAALVGSIGEQVRSYESLSQVPQASVGNVRNDMYIVSEAARFYSKDESVRLDGQARTHLTAFRALVDDATRFIPLWVKVAVAIALGLGTMVGWKRIVVTVGEKIGKTHLTYAQGASAELVAMATIGAADGFGLPVSTTHVLSSGVAGTMAANGSGLQMATVRNLALAWVLTMPVAIVLSGGLYSLLLKVF